MPRMRALPLLLALTVPGRAAVGQQGGAPGATTLVTGVVRDTISGRPLHVAVVRVAETGASTLPDERGRYVIAVSPGLVRLEVRRIGYQPASVTLGAQGAVVQRPIYLRPLAIGLAPVTVTGRDEFARRLVLRAIARKHAVYGNIHDYHVLDTLAADGRRVFRVAIEPTSQASPLFVGVIDIADSTYDVLHIDVGTNEAVRINMLRNLRYQQHLRDMGDGRWLPYDIRFSGDLFVAIPVPGFAQHMSFEQVAALDHFRF